VHAQTLQDAQRLEQAGAIAVRVSGNFKFDVRIPADQVAKGKEFAGALERRILTIASTREGEEEMFVQAIEKQIRRARAQATELIKSSVLQVLAEHMAFQLPENAMRLCRSDMTTHGVHHLPGQGCCILSY